jgi:hypothetical protein
MTPLRELDGLKPSSLESKHMSNRNCPIAEVLFPQVRAKVLEILFTRPVQHRYVRELTNLTNLSLHTVQDELRKLSALGIVTTWSNGYHRFYSANPSHPLFAHLLEIMQLSTRLPMIKHAALRRPNARPRRRQRHPTRPLPPDRQPHWNLLKSPNQT